MKITKCFGKSMVAMDVPGCYAVTFWWGKSLLPTEVISCYGQLMVTMDVTGCYESHWLICKPLVAMERQLLFWKSMVGMEFKVNGYNGSHWLIYI
jgi:hypothetical protein